MEKENLKSETPKTQKALSPIFLLAAVLMLIIWSAVTLVLAVSVLGWFGLMILDESDSGWFEIPKRCFDAVL